MVFDTTFSNISVI